LVRYAKLREASLARNERTMAKVEKSHDEVGQH